MAAESGMMFSDTLWIWRHQKSSFNKVTIENLDQVIELFKNGKGLIVLVSHLGGFEIVPRIFAEHTRATVMYRQARKKWVNELDYFIGSKLLLDANAKAGLDIATSTPLQNAAPLTLLESRSFENDMYLHYAIGGL